MRRYLPHYLTCDPSAFHLDLLADLADLHLTRGRRKVYRGPRGSGKTSYLSKGYPLYCALEGVEPLTLLLAETGEQAEGYLRAIKAELETNHKIAADYARAAGVGPTWQQDRIVLRNGCGLVARGTGGRVLGLTQGARRPTLVVGDDLNQRADAYSPTMRRRKLQWYMTDVLNVGEPGSNFLVAGTSIHREAIVCELSRTPGWEARRYPAVRRWPDRADLWAEWERVYANLADPDAEAKALAFYAANRAEMDRGGEVLWPDREPLYDLMKLRAVIGPSAFKSEKLDEPGTDGATEWPAELFEWDAFHFDRWPADLVLKVQSLDPSKGTGSDAADYQAHVQLGLGADGTLYADAELRREHDFVGRMLDLAQAWGPNVVVAESNNTMGLLVPEIERQLAERRAANRPVQLAYEEVYHTLPKLARVRCLSGYISRKQLRVRNTPGGRMLAEQLRDVPNGEYDDGPDALATAVRKLEELVNGRE